MNPLTPYKDKKVAIVCQSFEEATRIDGSIVELGGRSLIDNYSKDHTEFVLDMEHIFREGNCWNDSLDWYREWSSKTKIIYATDILSDIVSNNYPIC